MKVRCAEWLSDILFQFWALRCRLGNAAAEETGRTDEGKRQTVFEHDAVMLVKENPYPKSVLQVEGWSFARSSFVNAEWVIGIDPTDGTAGDARFHGVGVLKDSLPLSLVATIRENIADPTFASVKYAGILDFRTGQIFVAGLDGASTYANDKIENTLARRPQYNQHAPAVACEITRRALAPLRWLIPYGVYPEMYADSHSSALVILWTLLGYGDVYFNCELPGIQGAGQRGHELGAVAVFARALGACAYHTGVEDGQIVVNESLDKAPYTFDGQTSVILGVDECIVGYYINLINDVLQQRIQVGNGIFVPAHELLAAMYRDCPDKRWKLPLVS